MARTKGKENPAPIAKSLDEIKQELFEALQHSITTSLAPIQGSWTSAYIDGEAPVKKPDKIVKYSGKFSVDQTVKIKKSGANGSSLKRYQLVTVVKKTTEGYVVKDADGETWIVFENHLAANTAPSPKTPKKKRPKKVDASWDHWE